MIIYLNSTGKISWYLYLAIFDISDFFDNVKFYIWRPTKVRFAQTLLRHILATFWLARLWAMIHYSLYGVFVIRDAVPAIIKEVSQQYFYSALYSKCNSIIFGKFLSYYKLGISGLKVINDSSITARKCEKNNRVIFFLGHLHNFFFHEAFAIKEKLYYQ